ncbi:hypothetical protein [Chryseobacterium rhizosphaerae]|uniref:Uncharacterized protein n=1 Tax=Chryseobacterium rhizosphaerae TaxID=395937 RepID=A0ABX9IG04_9FLAO|nr:hypothetical protein [Chryseobacterium rhizosphaerae]REC72383.1 hypothetical protein DRF57_19240 [Chryseobacterium rhizosphaerae]GEN69057.1 hypothetical protein CRH01_36250 [Chryseobacterium rhizosphaerae]
MKLKSGIKIFCTDRKFEETVTINTGSHSSKYRQPTKVSFGEVDFEPQYEDEAYLPKRDWGKVEGQVVSRIQTARFLKDYNTAAIGRIPEELQSLCKQLNLHGATSEKEVLECFYNNKEIVERLNEGLNDFLQDLSADYSFHCIAAGYPNCETTSVDRRNLREGYQPHEMRFIGLHKDSSDRKMTIGSSHRHGNRLTINLGQESRYFLFINLTMIQIYNMLKKKTDVKKENITNKNIIEYFFKYFPDYPVLKIEQKPYDFYIAPTDNCIHDGSTLDAKTLDITMVFLGHFTML